MTYLKAITLLFIAWIILFGSKFGEGVSRIEYRAHLERGYYGR